MSNFIDDCKETISQAQKLLTDNQEWESRYEKYGNKLVANLDKIKKSKEKTFNEWAPLYLYMKVSSAMSNLKFSLRYLGQDVAKITVGKNQITISTKGFETKNHRDFGCSISLQDCEWRSDEAKKFRNHFSSRFKRTINSGKKNEEHRIESMLLTEFSKKTSKDKKLCNIQPIRLAGIARFQMPTPLSASDVKKLRYCEANGGGIDILSRIGKANGVRIGILEVKDEYKLNEPPTKVIQQALVYATFIQKLLRSKSGETWWNIFGFGRTFPVKLNLIVTCVMPSSANNDKSFADMIIPIGSQLNDTFQLHYIYFKEEDNKLLKVETSLKQCNVKIIT